MRCSICNEKCLEVVVDLIAYDRYVLNDDLTRGNHIECTVSNDELSSEVLCQNCGATFDVVYSDSGAELIHKGE